MWKQLPYKKRIIYLAIGFVIFLLLSYSMAIKKTVQIKRDCKDLKSQIGQVNNAPQIISNLSKRLTEIDDVIGAGKDTHIDLQDLIVDEVSHYCQRENINFREFPGIHIINEQDFIIETHIVKVQGGFRKLIRLLYLMETEYNLGKISSVRFYTTKNIKTKQTELLLEMYIQNIKIIRNE